MIATVRHIIHFWRLFDRSPSLFAWTLRAAISSESLEVTTTSAVLAPGRLATTSLISETKSSALFLSSGSVINILSRLTFTLPPSPFSFRPFLYLISRLDAIYAMRLSQDLIPFTRNKSEANMTLGLGIFLSLLFLGTIALFIATKDRWNWKKIILWPLASETLMYWVWAVGHRWAAFFHHSIRAVNRLNPCQKKVLTQNTVND